MRAFLLLSLFVALTACGVPTRGDTHPTSANPDAGPAPGTVDAGPEAVDYAVFANSSQELYRINPDTLKVTLVGAFGWPSGGEDMTDIALDKTGNMVGISFGDVYSIDPKTAKCKHLASLHGSSFNGLSFVPAEVLDSNTTEEVLVATTGDGAFYRLDPKTGASKLIGNFGLGLFSSGDVVSVTGFGTVATVKKGGADWLARLDVQTGKATPIGPTGVNDIWGLGFWKNQVFGFAEGNQFVLITPTTGVAKVVQAGNVAWWGAGVSTSAPVIQ